MLIRTQDRLALINSYSYYKIEIKDISIIREKHNYVIIACKDDEDDEDEIILGAYSSEENAIDALTYIQECTYLCKVEMYMPLEKDGELLK